MNVLLELAADSYYLLRRAYFIAFPEWLKLVGIRHIYIVARGLPGVTWTCSQEGCKCFKTG